MVKIETSGVLYHNAESVTTPGAVAVNFYSVQLVGTDADGFRRRRCVQLGNRFHPTQQGIRYLRSNYGSVRPEASCKPISRMVESTM